MLLAFATSMVAVPGFWLSNWRMFGCLVSDSVWSNVRHYWGCHSRFEKLHLDGACTKHSVQKVAPLSIVHMAPRCSCVASLRQPHLCWIKGSCRQRVEGDYLCGKETTCAHRPWMLFLFWQVGFIPYRCPKEVKNQTTHHFNLISLNRLFFKILSDRFKQATHLSIRGNSEISPGLGAATTHFQANIYSSHWLSLQSKHAILKKRFVRPVFKLRP